MAIIPFIEFGAVSAGPLNNVSMQQQRGAVRLIATKTIQKGEMIVISPLAAPNADILTT
jgi:hypothetical protein